MNPDLVPAFIFQMDILHYVCMAVGEVENSDRRPITSGDEFKAIGGEEGVETAKLVLIETKTHNIRLVAEWVSRHLFSGFLFKLVLKRWYD